MTPARFPRRSAYAAVVWLASFAVSHVAAAIWPGDDPTDGGPWSFAAYLGYDITLIVMSVLGALLFVAALRGWPVPRPVLLVPLWFGSVLLVVRGVPGIVEDVSTAAGLTPHGLLGTITGAAADPASLRFWEAMGINASFFLGAVLLLPVTVALTRYSRGLRPATR